MPLLRLLFFRFAIAMAATSLATGCVTTSRVKDPVKLKASSTLKPVVISITANTGEISGFDLLWVVRVSEHIGLTDPVKLYSFDRVAPGMARDTSVFMGALSPGEYALSSLSSIRFQKSLDIRKNSKTLGHFIVRDDKPVDLGRLILTPVDTRVIYGRSASVKSNLPLLQRFSPKHAALFAGAVDTGWTGEVGDAAGAAVEASARARPVGAACLTELPDGSAVAASRVGSLLLRSPAGKWTVLRSDTLESLLCVTPVNLPDTELLAVGEFNTLLRKPRGSSTLVPVNTGDLPPGNLLRIMGSAETGWVVAHQSKEEITLYRSRELEGGRWQALRKESIAPNFWNDMTSFWMWKTARGFGYTLSAGPLHFYDMANGSWGELAVPGNGRVANLSENPNGALGMVTEAGSGFARVFKSAWFSTDEGQTWNTVSMPSGVSPFPVQFNAQGDMLATVEVNSTWQLQISRDSGRTWSQVADYPGWHRFLPLRSGTLVDASTFTSGLFSIRRSLDGGKTWATEYTNFNEAIYDPATGTKRK